MNELMLFKAWDKRNKKMVQPNNGDFIGWHAMQNWRDCLEILPYTGKEDVDGAPIFAGDNVTQIIVSDFLHPDDWVKVSGTVRMIDGCWCVGKAGYPLYAFKNKLVGNSFEDPDFEFKVEKVDGEEGALLVQKQ